MAAVRRRPYAADCCSPKARTHPPPSANSKRYPNATSSTIINAKPSATPIVPILE